MKRILYYTTAVFLVSSLVSSCKSNDKNSEELEEIEQATVNMEMHQSEEHQKMNNEYQDFKAYALAEIDENDQNIIKLKQKIQRPGNTLDEARARRVEDLREQNAALRARLNNYEANTSDWQSFKTNFNAELDDMGNNFSDIFAGDSKD